MEHENRQTTSLFRRIIAEHRETCIITGADLVRKPHILAKMSKAIWFLHSAVQC